MIVREFYAERKDGVRLYKTFSDINHYIRKVGTEEIYSEAIDIESAGFEYEETENEIIVEPIEETIEEDPGKIGEPTNY